MHGLVIPLGVIGVLLALIGKEPDLGTPSLMFGAAILVLFVSGSRMRWIFAALGSAVPVVAEELWRKPYRRARLMTFLKPFENIKGTGYPACPGHPRRRLRRPGSARASARPS